MSNLQTCQRRMFAKTVYRQQYPLIAAKAAREGAANLPEQSDGNIFARQLFSVDKK